LYSYQRVDLLFDLIFRYFHKKIGEEPVTGTDSHRTREPSTAEGTQGFFRDGTMVWWDIGAGMHKTISGLNGDSIGSCFQDLLAAAESGGSQLTQDDFFPGHTQHRLAGVMLFNQVRRSGFF
jgi:hypothetical protein